MRTIKIILLSTIILVLMSACKRDTPNNANTDASAPKSATATATAAAATNMNYSQVANELCACMQPLIDLNKKIQGLAKSGNNAEVQKLINEVEKLSEEGEACTERLESKYGKIEGKNQSMVEAAMAKSCPDVARMISSANRQEQ